MRAIRSWYLILVSVGLCACTLQNPTPTETPPLEATPEPVQEFHFKLTNEDETPILPESPSELLDGYYRDPGAVIYHDGQFHMFFNSSSNYPPSEVGIGYAVSADGENWEILSSDTVLAETDLPYPVESFLVGAVLVEDDGTWVLYFYTRDAKGNNPTSRIGRATATDPLGPWVVDVEPVLIPDPEGWDSLALQRPDVKKINDSYYMVYTGVGEGNLTGMIGMATSQDGIHWTKYDDPQTQDAAYLSSDPIVQSTLFTTETRHLHYPRLLFTEDGWLLFLQINRGGGAGVEIHVLTSPDGVHWQRLQNSAVFTSADFQGYDTAFLHTILFIDQQYYMFIELSTRRGCDVYLAK